MTCPLCRGTGEIEESETRSLKRKEEAVIVLHKAGYLHREIKDLIGYKREASITHILKKYHV